MEEEKEKEYLYELFKMINATYDKKELYILTDEEWKEYQKLKKRDQPLVGAGFC